MREATDTGSRRPGGRGWQMRCKHPKSTMLVIMVIGLLWTASIRGGSAYATSETGQLLVFHQGGVSSIEKTFIAQRLSELRRFVKTMGVAVHLVDVRMGAPAEIAVTPLIAYQNHRGRSIYQGRTTTPERIRNFIRTSRFIPQGNTPNQREHVPIWRTGRARIWAPIKITPLAGSIPDAYDPDTFLAEATRSIATGFKNFHLRDRISLGRADRGFYMDFYPYLTEDGALYLSLALFSQFNCKEPVFVEKIRGSWRHRQRIFHKGAAILESALLKTIQDPGSGDSFDPVAVATPVRTWEEIGFPLPLPPEVKETRPAALAKIPGHWTFGKPGPLDPPMIQFRFPAPLDSYAGEVKTARIEFNLPAPHRLEDAGGFIEIDTRSAVTMGNGALDDAIRGSMILDAKNYPKASFVIRSIESNGDMIVFNRLLPASIDGTFELKGKQIPLTRPAEFELVVGEDETPRLLIRTAFTIDLRAFNIEEADGPAPARYTLLFDVNLQLKKLKED